MRFCEIGMPRTGTRSLWKAMHTLGYSASHGMGLMNAEERTKLSNFILYGKVPYYIYHNYDYVGNLPMLHWEELSQDDLKFILPIRDVDDWWKGVYRKWSRIRRYRARQFRREGIPLSHLPSVLVNISTMGSYGLNETLWKKRFVEHNQKVIDHFKGSDTLLVFNVFSGDSWKELCNFIGHEQIPEQPFPHKKSVVR